MRSGRVVTLFLALGFVVAPLFAQQSADPDLRLFFTAASGDKDASEDALEAIEKQWKNGYAPMLVEWVRFLPSGKAGARDPLAGVGGQTETRDFENFNGAGADNFRSDSTRFSNRRRDPKVKTRERIVKFLEKRTGQKHGDNLKAWNEWLWAQPYDPHPMYGIFKAQLYGSIDENFKNFFHPDGTDAIRLDEIGWGGVKVGGIPPLDHVKTVAGAAAGYLADSDRVFGISVGGEARAYPQRILAWHELAWDQLGGEELTIVYCTLCGTVVPYKSEIGGRLIKFNTSGLLYRSNKLLFDDVTGTLWSSLTGEAVSGRMVGRGVRLVALPVVTTSWGEWRAAHPDTTVVSLDTGFQRDYTEGAAYAEYFASDELMFEVAEKSNRLANKEEVLSMRFARPDGGDDALAITASFLARNRLYQTNFAGRDLVVVTSPGGANRVYAASGVQFVELVGDNRVKDSTGTLWTAGEASLVPDGDPGAAMARLGAFRAFWFGWYAQYPETELIAD